ncbi:MAG: ribbon-helix-helix domain-containing protein [Halobacteria archaeon]
MSSVSEDTEQINIRVTETFLEKIDETWQGRGPNSRSEYIRHVLHDAVENPTFDRDELAALALTEREIRKEKFLNGTGSYLSQLRKISLNWKRRIKVR